MKILPSIGIKQGCCVHMFPGQFDNALIYSYSPVDIAKKWQRLGSKYVHITDLDGAITGKPHNLSSIEEILNSTNLKVQLGGGIRNLKTVEQLINKGVDTVILGTSAIKDPDFLTSALSKYGNKIIVSIDSKNGKVATDGWFKTSEIDAIAHAKKMQHLGINSIIYTNLILSTELTNVHINLLSNLTRSLDLNIIYSGGINSIDQLLILKQIGFYGCILGKPLYTNKINFKEALKLI